MSDLPPEDRLAIREVYGRYALAVARKDGAEWLQCWTAQASWKTPQFEVSGQAALEQMWGATWIEFETVAVFNEPGPVTLEGDEASLLSNVFEVVTLKSGSMLNMTGLYTDRLRRENGEWRFASRAYTPTARPVPIAPAQA